MPTCLPLIPTLLVNTFVEFPNHPDGCLRLKVVWGQENFIREDFRANAFNTLLIDWSLVNSILNLVNNAIFPPCYVDRESDKNLEILVRYFDAFSKSGRSVPQYLTKKPITLDHGGSLLSMEYKSLALKVLGLALWQDKSSCYHTPSYNHFRVDHFNYSRRKGHHFINELYCASSHSSQSWCRRIPNGHQAW